MRNPNLWHEFRQELQRSVVAWLGPQSCSPSFRLDELRDELELKGDAGKGARIYI